MPRTCTVCRHPERGEIDRALTGKESNRVIARQYALSHDAVRRHRAHVPASLAKAREAKEAAQADDLLASVQRLRKRLEKALETAAAARDVAALAREARETARLLLEVEGRLRQGTQVQVAVSVESVRKEAARISARVFVALSDPRFAEARALVLAAIAGPEDTEAVPASPRAATGNAGSAEALVAVTADHA